MIARIFSRRFRPLSVLLTIITVSAFGLITAGCDVPPPGGYSLTISVFTDNHQRVGYELNATDGSLVPGFAKGHLTACMYIKSTINNRHELCRVVNGYNRLQYTTGTDKGGALYDHTNWDVKMIAGHPRAVYKTGYGLSISTYDTPACQGNGCAPNGAANMFEGCKKVASWDGQMPLHSAQTSTDEFKCEFSVFDHAAPVSGTANMASMILSNAWPFFKHSVIGAAACAFGVMGLTAGTALALKILGTADCWEETHP